MHRAYALGWFMRCWVMLLAISSAIAVVLFSNFFLSPQRDKVFPYTPSTVWFNPGGHGPSSHAVDGLHAKMRLVLSSFAPGTGTYPYINTTQAQYLTDILRSTSVNTFCEGRYGGLLPGAHAPVGWYFPECFSSLTAIWISVCGIFMLRTWKTSSPFVQLISSLFFVNGFFSFLTHMTGFYRYLQPDGKSMVLLAWLVFAFIVQEIVQAWKRQTRKSEAVLQEEGHSIEKIGAMLRQTWWHHMVPWLETLAYAGSVIMYYWTTEVVELAELAIIFPMVLCVFLGIIVGMPRSWTPSGLEWERLHLKPGSQPAKWQREVAFDSDDDDGTDLGEALSTALETQQTFTRKEWERFETRLRPVPQLGGVCACLRSDLRDYHIVHSRVVDEVSGEWVPCIYKPRERWLRRRYKLPMDYGLVHPMVEEHARHTFGSGVLTTIVGALFWVVIELFCDNDKYALLRVVPAHGMWHVMVSVGLTNALSYAVVLHADDSGREVKFVTNNKQRAAAFPEIYWPHEPMTPLKRLWVLLALGWLVPSLEYRSACVDMDDARLGRMRHEFSNSHLKVKTVSRIKTVPSVLDNRAKSAPTMMEADGTPDVEHGAPVASEKAAPSPAPSPPSPGLAAPQDIKAAVAVPAGIAPTPKQFLVADAVFRKLAGPAANVVELSVVTKYLLGRGDMTSEVVQDIVSKLDANSDGSIDKEEWRVGFTAGLVAHPAADLAAAAAAGTMDRQADAEDKFLLADTSGDGYVDEDELLVLVREILKTTNGARHLPSDARLRAFLQTFRTEAEMPLNLSFDDFVGVYNAIGVAMDEGQLDEDVV